MVNLFGPQGPNFSLTRPARDPNASNDVDTWFKNCSAANSKDGTFATADFFNTVLGNLRYLVREAGVAETYPLPDTNVYDAVLAIVDDRIATLAPDLTASRGVIRVDDDLRLALGDGSLTVLSAIDPAADKINLFDASANAIVEALLGKAVSVSLIGGTGITTSYDNTTGLTTISLGEGGGGAVWRFGTGVPSNALGNDGDYYARTDASGLYTKISGAWVPLFDSTSPNGGWLFGTGIPGSGLGANGNYYARVDTPGGIYVKIGGVWVSLTAGYTTPGPGAIGSYALRDGSNIGTVKGVDASGTDYGGTWVVVSHLTVGGVSVDLCQRTA